MATEGELTTEPVDDGEWVLFWSLALMVLYVAFVLAVVSVGAILL